MKIPCSSIKVITTFRRLCSSIEVITNLWMHCSSIKVITTFWRPCSSIKIITNLWRPCSLISSMIFFCFVPSFIYFVSFFSLKIQSTDCVQGVVCLSILNYMALNFFLFHKTKRDLEIPEIPSALCFSNNNVYR